MIQECRIASCPFASDDRSFRDSERKILNAVLFNLSNNIYAILPLAIRSRIKMCVLRYLSYIIFIYISVFYREVCLVLSKNVPRSRHLHRAASFDDLVVVSRHYFTNYLFSRFIARSSASHIRSSRVESRSASSRSYRRGKLSETDSRSSRLRGSMTVA